MTKDNEDALRCADRCHGLSTIDDAYSEEAYRDAATHLRRLVQENEDLTMVLRNRNLEVSHALDRIVAKDALLRQAEALLKRIPKATMAMYVGKDRVGYGIQAKELLQAIRQHLESKQ